MTPKEATVARFIEDARYQVDRMYDLNTMRAEAALKALDKATALLKGSAK